MKYYKIVNQKGHHGLKYHEGLNTDPLPFNPNGDCEDGGIYFAREDILSFVHYGTELYEVEPVGEVYENLQIFSNIKKWKAHLVVLKHIGPVRDNITFLLEQGVDIHAYNDNAFRMAVMCGNLGVVKCLVENGANIHVHNGWAKWWSEDNGYSDIANYLKSL